MVLDGFTPSTVTVFFQGTIKEMEPKFRVEADMDGNFTVVDNNDEKIAWCSHLGNASRVASSLNRYDEGAILPAPVLVADWGG